MGRALPARICAMLLACALFFPLAARADIQTIRSADSEVWASAGESLLNYKESIPITPDGEHGWTPSFAGGVSYLTNGNWYFALDAAYTFGDDQYSGFYYYLNNPNVLYPTKLTTKESITTVDGKIGRGFTLGKYAMLTPYGEFGFRYWGRQTDAQTEDYQNFDFLFGLMGQVSPVNRLVLSAYGSYGPTFGAQMKSDGVTYNLGSAGMMKLGGKVGFNLTQRLELFTTLDYDHLHYVKSAPEYDQNLGGYFLEPSSHTNDTAWRVGLGYHFK